MVNVYVIYGAPASGKTTYVKNKMVDGEIVYDFDDLMRAISGLPYQRMSPHLMGYVLGMRDMIINKLRVESTIKNAYIITTFLSDDLITRLNDMRVTYIKMPTHPMVCISRVNKSDRIDKDRVHGVIYDWYNKYTKPSGYLTDSERKKFYNSVAWNNVRTQALKRDNYECSICRDKGKAIVDSIKVDGERKEIVLNVHHKLELEKFPELATDLNNLTAICVPCHNRIHNKQFGRKKEQKWKDERW